MSKLVEKLHAIDTSLAEAGLRHAFGGAIALAYCTGDPRGTRDLDVNIFSPAEQASTALAALPQGVKVSSVDVEAVERDGQTRLWWDDTPIDVFLSNLEFHSKVAERVRMVPLAGRDVPVLDCASLAVFKAYFDRTKDWADLEAMAMNDPTPLELAAAEISALSGDDDPRRARILEMLDSRVEDPAR